MKARIFIMVGVCLVLAAAVAIPYLVHREVQSCIGPRHTYELSEQPRALSQELALAKAQETLRRDGLDVAAWRIRVKLK